MINFIPSVRIIKQWDIRYWEEFEIASLGYKDRIVLIQRTGWFSIYDFADVQFLTPVQYEWRYIGLGDKVNGKEVFDYVWSDWEWRFRASREWNYSGTYLYDITEIRSFEPLHKLTPKEIIPDEIIFSNNWNEWSAYNKACEWLRNHWYSYWSMQWDANIWFIKWDVLISKWRWLSKEDIDSLDGYITNIGGHRNGSAKIIFTK